ncbi:MAG: fumarylacetoacetate hydrolase family protein [Alphaproteobacteria bacterium]|nr:fumarylacetoacetate hydrolase family protein [Alphaproteobacteria bacterium]
MKLASLKHGRDGSLVIVSKDLTKSTDASAIAPTLQAALDDWKHTEPKLKALTADLEAGTAEVMPFRPEMCASPLPRAYQWLDASAYVNHVELVRKSRGVEMPESFWTDPLMYQGGSDAFLGPRDNIMLADENWGIDFEAEIAVVTDDVPMGVTPEDAEKHIKLVMLVNDVSLRFIAKEELKKGFGFVQSKPSSAFSPTAITPDELGAAWKDGKVHLPITTSYNGETFGTPDAGTDMVFDFRQLIAHAARTRPLCAGTIIGSGTVSNKDRSKGSSCIVERVILEKMDGGQANTKFMQFGDSVRIEMRDAEGNNVFGTIEQTVHHYKYVAQQKKKTA